MKSRISAVALALLGFMGTVQAAEKIRYANLASSRPFIDGQSTVVTTDGMGHAAARIHFEPNQAVLYRNGSVETISSERIARVEVKRRGRFFAFTLSRAADVVEGPAFLCGREPICLAISAAIVSPIAVVLTVGSAPITLTAEGVLLFIPPKVYEIIH